jgi:hypothetical protein
MGRDLFETEFFRQTLTKNDRLKDNYSTLEKPLPFRGI